MSNPFSAFLTPQNNRPIDVSAGFEAMNQMRARGQDRQAALENTQRNALAQQASKRSDAELAIQQGYQNHKFTEDDRKQVEGLLSEYHDALDTGDQERVHRATEMLKRFGMDVKKAGAPPPNLGDFGSGRLPNVPTRPEVKASPGKTVGEPDLSQSDFENQLIDSTQKTPGRYEENGQTTPEFKKMLPQSADEPEPPSAGVLDIDDPANRPQDTTILSAPQEEAFQQWGKKNGIRDLNDPSAHYDYRGFFLSTQGKPHPPGSQLHFPDTFKQHGHETFSQESKYSKGPGDGGSWNGETFMPQNGVGSQPQAQQPPPRLSTQLLPTIISRNGKVLEESNGAAGRYSPMVASVFDAFTQHENPEVAAAGKRAQALASKLVTVDGISPKQAIDFAGKQMQDEISGINQLQRTVIGSRAHVIGSGKGPGAGILGAKEDRAESIDKYGDNIQQAIQAAGIPKSEEQMGIAEAALRSGDPSLQKDGLKAILLGRSGLTVSEGERRSYAGIDGSMGLVQSTLAGWTGQALPPGTVKALLAIVQNIRHVNETSARRIADREEKRYRAQNRDKVSADRLEERARTLRPDDQDDPNAHLWE